MNSNWTRARIQMVGGGGRAHRMHVWTSRTLRVFWLESPIIPLEWAWVP